jgi:hypothetical protein
MLVPGLHVHLAWHDIVATGISLRELGRSNRSSR